MPILRIVFIRGYSSFVVVVRHYSCGIVFVRLQSHQRFWHSSSEMCIAYNRPPELVELVEALTLRKGVFQLKGRLLKAVRSELRAAKDSGLTWRVIWETLREEGYPGGYQQFCKAANRVIEGIQPHIARKTKNLPATSGGKSVERSELRSEKQPEQVNTSQEKPEWQIQREELMARLDREAELNRQREERLRPVKIFKPSPFVGRGEE